VLSRQYDHQYATHSLQTAPLARDYVILQMWRETRIAKYFNVWPNSDIVTIQPSATASDVLSLKTRVRTWANHVSRQLRDPLKSGRAAWYLLDAFKLYTSKAVQKAYTLH